jgi:hypothetical protein
MSSLPNCEWNSEVTFYSYPEGIRPIAELWKHCNEFSGERVAELMTYGCAIHFGGRCFTFEPFILIHEYIVFRTTNYWWSIEKNCSGLIIQRSLYPSDVVCQYQKTCRQNVQLRKQTSRWRPNRRAPTLCDVLNWIFATRENSRNYHWLADNCQTFVARFWTEFVDESSCQIM